METPVEVVETPAEPVEVDGITTHSVETDLAALNKERDLEAVEQESIDPQPEAAAEEPKEEAKPAKKSRSQKRIERLAKENAELKAEKAKREAESKTVETPAAEPEEINIDDYEDYESYEAAVKAAETQEPTQPKETPSSPETPTTTPAREGDILDLLDEGKEAYEDFDELVGAEDLALTEDILDYVLDTDNGTDMTYYLATHKDETLEIAQMRPAARVKALAKIEIKLENKPAKTVKTTKAPKPITPATGISATGKTLNDDNLSFKEHEALLNAREQNSAGGFL